MGCRPGRRGLLLLASLLAGLLAAGCAPSTERFDVEAPLPATLAELGVLELRDGVLAPVEGIAYSLAHPLFSDYARKYRTLHLPPGERAQTVTDGDVPASEQALRFPVGTLITKTFYYPRGADAKQVVLGPPAPAPHPDAPLQLDGRRLIETRVLVHRADGWDAVAYLWDASGSTARRVRTGALVGLEATDGRGFDYLVPDVNQCGGCHATDHGSRALAPIGPKPGNLAAVRIGGTGQYRIWARRGLVETADVEAWPAAGSPAPRAYLDANCAHCHSDTGAADTAGLDLRRSATARGSGLCKSPVAAGRGSGGLAVDIHPGRPDASILVYRMESTDPGILMPELGRSLVHAEGVRRVRDWIGAMEGSCDDAS
ncbi:MAG: hypothetical protein U5R48_01930 [Gammaproteobacteria bacterium]|nr:hypothetical protein [Gammaproteobacteria bacterium]